MSAFTGEVVGTFILIVFGLGVCAGASLKKSFAYNAGWVVISIAWGLAVTMAIFAVGHISGAHLNPAVTIAFAIHGVFPWSQVPIYIFAQLLGAFLGSVAIFLHYYPHWKATEDPVVKLAVFSTSPAMPHPFFNLLSETFGTCILIMSLLFIGANKFSEGLNPITVGLLIILITMSLAGTTGAAHNPARDLGPRIAHFFLPIHGKGSSNWNYAWIPIVGPILGGSFGSVFYDFLFQNKLTMYFWVVLIVNIIIFSIVYLITRKKIKQEKSFEIAA